MKSLIPEWAEIRLKEHSNPIFTAEQIAHVRSITAPRIIDKVLRETITLKKKPGRPRKE